MGERSILSYFSTSDQAAAAQKELWEMGIEVAEVDQFGHVPDSEWTDELYNPLAGEIQSNTNLVEDTALEGDSAQLLISDPAVNGLAGSDHVRARSFILTVVTDDEKVDKAVRVIKKHQGYV
jgi:hypothetical protein